jgi:CO dehydrogenase maturation factor
MCGAHATVRGFLAELVAHEPESYDVIVDMEAGLEHLSRGTGKHVSRFLAVVEPYYRSMETARRIAELAGELGVTDVRAVTNKIRTEADRRAVSDFCTSHGMRVIAELPYDNTLLEAERSGRPPVEAAASGPAVAAMYRLADQVLRSA